MYHGYDLTPEAQRVVETAAAYYKKTDNNQLYDLDMFCLTKEELDAVCAELDGHGIAWLETDSEGDDFMYLNAPFENFV